jgi:hypothetical protein
LLGWSFFGGEIAGGLIFIVISALVIAWVYPSKVKKEAIQSMSQPFVWNWQAWLNAVFIPLSLFYFFWGSRSMK